MTFYITLVADEDPKKSGIGMIVSETMAFIRENGIECVGDPEILKQDFAIQITLSKELSSALFRKLAKKIREKHKTDIFYTKGTSRKKRLLICDMDKTIVTSETLDEIALNSGISDLGSKISDITRKAMNGELNFEDALRERVAMLAGLPEEILQKTLLETCLSKDASILVKTMRFYGAKTVLVTGGFSYFSEKIATDCGFEFNIANRLIISGGKITGEIGLPVIDKNSKKEALQKFCNNYGLSHEDSMAIGDGANDLPMLLESGLAIGYQPKQVIFDNIDNVIVHSSLIAALYAQGYSHDEISVAVGNHHTC